MKGSNFTHLRRQKMNSFPFSWRQFSSIPAWWEFILNWHEICFSSATFISTVSPVISNMKAFPYPIWSLQEPHHCYLLETEAQKGKMASLSTFVCHIQGLRLPGWVILAMTRLYFGAWKFLGLSCGRTQAGPQVEGSTPLCRQVRSVQRIAFPKNTGLIFTSSSWVKRVPSGICSMQMNPVINSHFFKDAALFQVLPPTF